MENVKHITLTLTEACNLRCVYCYEAYKNTRNMTFEKAVEILDTELNADDEFDYVEIAFHGGEPLLEYELLHNICEYVWAHSYKHNYYFFATTNGTQLTDAMKQWFSENSYRIMLGLSLDGTPLVHNHNRSNSYSKIDFDFFIKHWPQQPVKMTISDFTVNYLSSSIQHIHELGFQVTANFAFGIDWSSTNLDRLDAELANLVEYYLQHPELEVCSLLNQSFQNIGAHFQRWCGAGTSMRVYDVDGKLFPCHFFQGFAIGDEKSKASESIDFRDDRLFINNTCKECVLLPMCPTCYGFNFASTGDIAKRDEGICELTKHCVLAASYLAYQRLKQQDNDQLHISDEIRSAMMHGIYEVQRYFADRV